MKPAIVDFNFVEPHQRAMHARLENWARWSSGRTGSDCHPMFRGYFEELARQCTKGDQPEIDGRDAHQVQVAVSFLPEPHRHALAWAYIHKGNHRAICEKLAVSKAGLWQMLKDARQILINRMSDPVGA